MIPGRAVRTLAGIGDAVLEVADVPRPLTDVLKPRFEAGKAARVDAAGDHPQLAAMGRLTLLESLKCLRMALWSEEQRRGVSFRELRALAPAAAA